jgi:predicted PurR-regulated permease PerM
MNQPDPATDRREVARNTLVVIGLVLATALTLFVVYQTRRVLVWIAIAAFFAVALYPVVNWVDRRVTFLGRWFATLVVYLVVFAALAGLVTALVLPLVKEGGHFVDQAPQVISDIRAGRGPVGDLARRTHALDWISNHEDQIKGYASRLGGHTYAFVRGVATTLAGVLSIIVLSYLMVLEGPRALDVFLGLFRPATAERIRRVGADCARTITGYLTGNLLISVICGGLTWLVLFILGVPFAGLIALFVAIADLIPLVGATLGAIGATIPALLHSVTAGVIVIVFFVVYQQLENHLLQPLVFSRTVRLNPLTVLIAVLLGVELAGILGALLAIPVAGTLQIIVRDLWHGRRSRVLAADGTGGVVLAGPATATPREGALPPGEE